MSVQQVNKYPWEPDDSIRYLQKCLNGYSKLLEQLDLNKTQEMDSLEGKFLFWIPKYCHLLNTHFYLIILECEEEKPAGSLKPTIDSLGPRIDDDCDI